MATKHNLSSKKASRKTISCENCRARKVRCSRESPCQHCVKRGEDCLWKADAHPLVRHTKGHSYSETDSTILHKTIDILSSRLTMSSEEIDDLIRSFVPSGSPSHSESEGNSDTPGSPIHSPVNSYPMASPKQGPLSPSSLSYLPQLSQPSLTSAWNANPPNAHQPSFTMPRTASRSNSLAYGSSSEGWPQHLSVQEQLAPFNFQPPSSSQLVLPQATTPSAYPSNMNGYFDTLPLLAMGSPSVQAQPQTSSSRDPEATFNHWLTSALGQTLGAGYPLPASNSSAPILAY